MKKTAIIVVLIWCLIVGIVWPYRVKSYADPFTAGQIASTAYAMMNGFGISFASIGASAQGMNDFMKNEVEGYVNSMGGSIADVFIGNIAVDAAGKLVVGYQMYNSVLGFVDWLKDKYTLSAQDFSLCDGFIDGQQIGKDQDSPSGIKDSGLYALYSSPVTNSRGEVFYQSAKLYNGPYLVSTQSLSGNYGWKNSYSIDYNGTSVRLVLPRYSIHDGAYRGTNAFTVATTSQFPVTDKLSWNGTDFVEPTVLNPDKEWTGTIGGYSQPDTNLDQLMGNIDQAVADNNLVVDGEVIDVPIPPTPVPTIEPGDIDAYWERQAGQMEGLGQDINDISGKLDDLGDIAGDITDALEGVQEGIQTQTGVISGAIEQANQDVIDAIGEQTGVLDESLTQTAEGVQEIVDALQPGDIEPRQFDLRRLFPFCIPFDIHNLLQKFNAAPVAPHVQLPFVIQSIGFSYMFDLDFSAFDSVAAAMRTVEFIVFAIGLAWATSKVIKW